MAITISSILLKNGSDNWFYKGSDNKVYSSQSNQFVGDIMSWGTAFENFDPNEFSWADLVASHYIENGNALYFAKGSKYYRQYFQYENESDAYQPLNNIIDITDNLYGVEDTQYIDINKDGYKGTPPPVVSKLLIARESGPGWGDAFYLTTDGELIASSSNLEYSEGDTLSKNDLRYYNNFSPEKFSFTDLIARDGLDTIYFYNETTANLYLQSFKEGSDWNIRETNGSPKNMNQQIKEFEVEWGIDINLDGTIGEILPVVEKVIFRDNWDGRTLYLLDDGSYSFNYSDDYEIGDELGNSTPIISGSNLDLNNAVASDYADAGPNATAGAKLLFKLPAGGFTEQKFKQNNSDYSTYGSLKSIESDSEKFYRWETDRNKDFNNDGFEGAPINTIEKFIFKGQDKSFVLDDLGNYRLIESYDEFETGDDIDSNNQIVLSDGLDDSIDLDKAVAFQWENSGFSLWFNIKDSDDALKQKFKSTSSDLQNSEAYSVSGNPKSYDPYNNKVINEESYQNLDINGDGFIGKKDIEVSEVLLSGEYESFYLTTDGDVVKTNEDFEYEEGDIIDSYSKKIVDQSGDPFDYKDGLRGFSWSNNGFDLIYKDRSKYILQGFSDNNDVASVRGKARTVTDRIEKYENNWDYDINDDGEIGAPLDTIKKVVLDNGNDDQGIYETSNGKLILSEGDLQKDDTFSYSQEFLDSKGDAFEVDGDIRAWEWADRGISLIYKENQKYKLQLFRERRGVFSANGKTRDITARIDKYEDNLGVDIDRDGSFGEQSSEVSKVLFSGTEGYMDMGIYRASNNELVASEPVLFKGDVFSYETKIVDSDGDPFEPGDRLAGIRGAKGGFSLIYQNGNKYYEQLFKQSRDVARQNGKKRDVTRKIAKLEEDVSIDLNLDGNYGEEAPVIQEVLFDGTEGYDWRGIYRLQNNSLIVSDTDLEKNDTPNYYSSIVDKNGYPFEPGERVAALRDSKNGFSIIYQDGEKYLEQIFKEVGDYARTNGKPRNVTKKIKKLEDDLAVDIDQDGLFGKEPPSIQKIYFDGIEGETDAGVYSLYTGELISADSELETDDTPSDYFTFVTSKGDPYNPPGNPSGLVSARGGYGLIYPDGGKFYLQQFRQAKDFLRQNGKPQNITSKIFKMEDQEGIDLNRDGVYGKDAPVIDQIIYGGSDVDEFGVYRMDDNNLIVAESDLNEGDIPFSVSGTLRSKKVDSQYDVDGKILGVITRSDDYYLFTRNDGKVYAQVYKPFGQDSQYLIEKGRATNITSRINKYEEEYFMDLDQNGIIGSAD